jgi:hypothetical protein
MLLGEIFSGMQGGGGGCFLIKVMGLKKGKLHPSFDAVSVLTPEVGQLRECRRDRNRHHLLTFKLPAQLPNGTRKRVRLLQPNKQRGRLWLQTTD